MAAVSRLPSLRDEQKALTRHRLLDGAEAAFARSGFHGASVEEIAREALGNGLALEKLADPDAVPDGLYGDMLVLIFTALEALARENPSAVDPPAASSSQAPAADQEGAKERKGAKDG
jgi:hypothetical protein